MVDIIKYTPKCLYNKNEFSISNVIDENVIYIGYIGIHNKCHTFKFGLSSRIIDRDLLEHQKTFKSFKIIYIKQCDNNKKVELIFKRYLQVKGLHRKIKFNQRNQNELFVININYSIKDIINNLDNIIEENPTKKEIKQQKIIQELKIKNLENKIEFLEKNKSENQTKPENQTKIPNFQCLICLKKFKNTHSLHHRRFHLG